MMCRRCLGIGIVVLVAGAACIAAPYVAELTPSADTFVRSFDPAGNYGKGGGLSVSGAAAVSGAGEQMGVLDTFLRFDLAQFVADADARFGGQPWTVFEATLTLAEQAAPTHPFFNRGVGAFEVRWIAADGWREGTGNPNQPKTDGIAYQDELSVLDLGTDLSLGQFRNAGEDAELTFKLLLPDLVVADVLSGGDVSLFLTAADPTVGFTFNSRDIKAPRQPPRLTLTANIPEPASFAVLGLGLCALRRARRRHGA